MKNEFSFLKSRMMQLQEMFAQELESVKETQKSQDEAITSLQRLENAESQHQKEVSLLHQNLDGLAQQVQDVQKEVQNLKHTPCDHNPSISKHRTGVKQDVAFQALRKDLGTSFTELSKLASENEVALQKHEQILVQQKNNWKEWPMRSALLTLKKLSSEMSMSRANYLKPNASQHWRK